MRFALLFSKVCFQIDSFNSIYFRDFVFNSSGKLQHLASDKRKIKYLYGNLLILFSHEVCTCLCVLSTGFWKRKFGLHICANYLLFAIKMYSNLCENLLKIATTFSFDKLATIYRLKWEGCYNIAWLSAI